jgi:hypothetical protein
MSIGIAMTDEENMQIFPQSINRSKGCNAFSLIPGAKSFVAVPPRLWPVDLVPFYVVAINMLGRERITNGY